MPTNYEIHLHEARLAVEKRVTELKKEQDLWKSKEESWEKFDRISDIDQLFAIYRARIRTIEAELKKINPQAEN
jgi:transcription-repair coupling factor (superfamily II helicase)